MVKKEEKMMEFVPFGAKDAIKLSVGIVQNLICVKTKAGKTCSDNEAIKFMMMCQAKALNPFEGDAFLIGYDNRDGGATFSLITAHQAFLKRAELHAEYDGMESGIILKNDDDTISEREGDFYEKEETVIGGWARVHFKNRKHPMYKRIRMERFKKAFGIWTEDAAGMIVKCAEADALRSSFPTMLGGLYMKEEVDREQSAPAMATPIFNSKVETTPAKPRAKPEVVDVEAKTDPKTSPVEELRKKCHEIGLKEEEMLQFMDVELALAKGDEQRFEDLSSESVEEVLSNWDRHLERIKEVTS